MTYVLKRTTSRVVDFVTNPFLRFDLNRSKRSTFDNCSLFMRNGFRRIVKTVRNVMAWKMGILVKNVQTNSILYNVRNSTCIGHQHVNYLIARTYLSMIFSFENVQSYQTNLKHDVYTIQLNFWKSGFVREFYHINTFIKISNETSVGKSFDFNARIKFKKIYLFSTTNRGGFCNIS